MTFEIVNPSDEQKVIQLLYKIIAEKNALLRRLEAIQKHIANRPKDEVLGAKWFQWVYELLKLEGRGEA